MIRARQLAALALGLALGLGTAPGIPAAGPRRSTMAEPGARQRAAMERRERVKQKIRVMRAYTLTTALSLDEQTASRLFPVLARYDDETDQVLEQRLEIHRRMGRVDRNDARAVDRLIDEALANQRRLWELDGRRMSDVRKILRPVQVAKLMLVLPEIDRAIQSRLRKAIAKSGRDMRVVDHPQDATAGDDDDASDRLDRVLDDIDDRIGEHDRATGERNDPRPDRATSPARELGRGSRQLAPRPVVPPTPPPPLRPTVPHQPAPIQPVPPTSSSQ